ncbi:MAG: hypothetical protein LAN37_15505 [Acidobacteriia bacterium]|nr:hypothetical protein [Terriglobia bacterium]
MSFRMACLTTAILFLAVVPALADEHQHSHFGNMERLGRVHFPISCSASAQQQFDVALAMLYSFWYEESGKAFAAIADTDPRCAMAYWGVAMSGWHQLWTPPPNKEELKLGLAAVEKARAVGASTDRERAYIAAIEAFYKDSDKLEHRARALAYEKAMADLSARYPDDREGAILYALALLATAPKTDKTFANQKQAGAILEKIYPLQPNHPGLTHFIIHSYDNPVLAQQGLGAARAYAKIAPDVPHALHMPSHIFVRLGYWQEAISSNLASAAAARDYELQARLPGPWDERLHAMDYLAYAFLQSGQEGEARRVLEEATILTNPQAPSPKSWYALAAIPARFTVERRHWTGAAFLMPRTGTWPAAEAITWWARALGAAHMGDLDAARFDVDKLQSLENTLLASKEAPSQYWAGQVEIQRREAAAWLLHLEGKDDQALPLMRSAAELEDTSDKDPMTPGPVVPARELLGDFLLELMQPAAALAEYETSLKTAPNRFNGLYGAARAAEQAGQVAKARDFYAKLLDVCGKANEGPELHRAREYLAKK